MGSELTILGRPRQLLAMFSVILLVTIPALAFACSCARLEDIEIDTIDVVFVGKAVDTENWILGWFSDDTNTTFQVLKSVKNAIPETTLIIHADKRPTMCGITSSSGEDYLILAAGFEGVLHASRCSAFPVDSPSGRTMLQKVNGDS